MDIYIVHMYAGTNKTTTLCHQLAEKAQSTSDLPRRRVCLVLLHTYYYLCL